MEAAGGGARAQVKERRFGGGGPSKRTYCVLDTLLCAFHAVDHSVFRQF